MNFDDYNAETNPMRRGDIFEKLVQPRLKGDTARKYRQRQIFESGTVFDGLSTLDGHPWVIEIKDRKGVMRLSAGLRRVYLPTTG